MKDYYVVQNASLEADETTLTIRADELRRIPVEQVGGLHLLSGYRLTSGVFDLAVNHGFSIHMYNFHGAYRGSFQPPPINNTACALVAQVQENTSAGIRLQRATEILQGANLGMNQLLRPFGQAIPALPRAASMEDLRLAEARLRKEYYVLLDLVLPAYWSIVRRERRPPQRPADAVLGFANGILYAKMSGWLHRAGLDPRVGYLHGDARASNPLALDLAEVLKAPLSEAALLTLAASGHERSLVTDVGEGCYLNDKGRREVISILEGLLQTETNVEVLGRRLTLGRVGELVAVKLHRAIITNAPMALPLPSCTLSSSTIRTLNTGRTSVESS